MIVFLVQVDRDRFELYTEPRDERASDPGEHAGRVRRWAHAANERWHELVASARRGGSHGPLARWRDAVVCRLAESIAEQRTLWALRHEATATLRYPSSIDAARSRAVLDRSLADSKGHHGRWLIVDLVLLIVSGILFFVPGPNIVAYYIAFRVIGHLNSWRGSRRALQEIAWAFEADTNLAELASLIEVPSETRAARVAAIAARLNLPRLTAFFARVAA
jgi:K+-H+ exchange-related protein